MRLVIQVCALIAFATVAMTLSASAMTNDDPARLAAARRMIAASGFEADLAALSAKYTWDYTQRLEAMRPEIESGEAACFHLAFQAQLDDQRKRFVEQEIVLFSRTHTVDELNYMTSYYSSPIGKALVAKHPSLVVQSAGFQKAWIEQAAAQAAHFVGIPPFRRTVTIWDRLADSLDALEGVTNTPPHLSGCSIKPRHA